MYIERIKRISKFKSWAWQKGQCSFMVPCLLNPESGGGKKELTNSEGSPKFSTKAGCKIIGFKICLTVLNIETKKCYRIYSSEKIDLNNIFKKMFNKLFIIYYVIGLKILE